LEIIENGPTRQVEVRIPSQEAAWAAEALEEADAVERAIKRAFPVSQVCSIDGVSILLRWADRDGRIRVFDAATPEAAKQFMYGDWDGPGDVVFTLEVPASLAGPDPAEREGDGCRT
jgi:hypothetical protein